jgi:hypothetical protein
VSNSKQKYKHEETGKVQEMTPAVAALFSSFKPVRLEVERPIASAAAEAHAPEPTLLMEPAIVPALESTKAQATPVARRDRKTER